MKKTPKIITDPEEIGWVVSNSDVIHRYKTILKVKNFVLVEILEQKDVLNDRIIWIWHLCRQYRDQVVSRTEPERAATLCGELSSAEIDKETCQYCKKTIPVELIGLLKMVNTYKNTQ